MGGGAQAVCCVSLSLTGCAAFAEENREEQLWFGMFKTAAGFSLQDRRRMKMCSSEAEPEDTKQNLSLVHVNN